MSELSDNVKELVELKGNKVGMHSLACYQWRKEHENCKGCLFELGCVKLVSIMLTSFDTDPDIDSILNETDPDKICQRPHNFRDDISPTW